MAISKHRITLDIELDEDVLNEHLGEAGGDTPPYSDNPENWDYFSDLSAAVGCGAVIGDDPTITGVEQIGG